MTKDQSQVYLVQEWVMLYGVIVEVVVLSGGSYSHNGMNGEV